MSESVMMRTCLMSLALVWLAPNMLLDPGTQHAQNVLAAPSQEQEPKRKTGLRMSTAIVCRTINGYEDYEVQPKAAQTSEEKLLVYFRPLGYQTERVDRFYEAHLVPDFQVRKRGQKEILLEKRKAYEFKPRSENPPRYLFMKNVISLKGLPPGEYDLTVILHDEIAKGLPAKQVVRFRVISAEDAQKQKKASRPAVQPKARDGS